MLEIAFISFVYAYVFTQPSMILGKLAEKAYDLESVYPFFSFIHKPLLTCHVCVAGQLGLWYSLYMGHGWWSLRNAIIASGFAYIIGKINERLTGEN